MDELKKLLERFSPFSSIVDFFLKRAKLFGNKAENGKMMFIYQAHQAFTIWNKLMPEINQEVINLLD